MVPFIPYIAGFGLLAIAVGITFSFIKQKFAFVPTLILLALGLAFIWLSQMPQPAGSWNDLMYVLFGLFFLFVGLVVGLITLLIKALKKPTEQIK
ncbi:MAG: hypothetical protein RBS87_05430 [Acholeplasma sp.]|jgi:hypothetical protein|nr:hypothetical protein [Acholeplasma sp.]